MRKLINGKHVFRQRFENVKTGVHIKTMQVGNKLKEQEGSLLEYLGEHIIGVVILALAITALVALVKTVVIPNLNSNITNAFSAGAK